MEIRFIVLEKAYATISREMTMGTLMSMGFPGEVRLVEGTRRAGSCVDRGCKEGESKVNVGVTQGSALTRLLFIAVVELISKRFV